MQGIIIPVTDNWQKACNLQRVIENRLIKDKTVSKIL